MANVDIECPNPFDGRPMRLQANIVITKRPWCDRGPVEDAYCTAVRALGRGWWDVMHVWHTVSRTPWAVPWITVPVETTSDGLTAVPVGVNEVVAVVDGIAHLAPRGYPPYSFHVPSTAERAVVQERLQVTFGRHAVLTTDDFGFIYRAVESTYFGVLNNRPNVRCAVRNCTESGAHTDLGWYGAGWTNICESFFAYSDRSRAATLAEEWLHQYGGVLHELTPPIREADYYSTILDPYLGR